MRRHSSESYLLSALLSLKDVHAAERLGITPEMFAGYGAEYRFLLSYAKTYGECPSPDTVAQRFPGFVFAPNEDVRFSADDVRADHNRRELAKVVRFTADSLRHGDLDSAMVSWGDFSPSIGTKALRQTLTDPAFLDNYGEHVETIEVPWHSLQGLTGGIGPGQYWTFAARLGVGKSWTALEMARHAAMLGYKVLIWSLEMPEKQCNTRMHALMSPHLGFDYGFHAIKNALISRREYQELLLAIEDNLNGNIFVLDSSHGTITPSVIAAHAEAADLHIVDHIGLMRDSSGARAISDWRVAATVSNELKEIAVSKKTRVLSLSQINREGDTSNWRPPRSKNLSQTDAIGQDSDVVVTAKAFSRSTMTYLLDKNRDGPGDRLFWTNFDVERGRFGEITRDQAVLIKDNEEDVDD